MGFQTTHTRFLLPKGTGNGYGLIRHGDYIGYRGLQRRRMKAAILGAFILTAIFELI